MGEEGGGRGGNTPKALQKLKQQALEYYRENDVPRRLEELLNSTFYLQPADVYGHLANYFSKLAKPPTICKIEGKIVLDGLGFPTIRVEIHCTIQNFPKHICSVMMATHFDVLENALPEMLDAEELERNLAVSAAAQWINETMTEELWGMVPSNQAEVDLTLRTFFENKVQEDKERKELEKSMEESATHSGTPVPPPPPPPPPTKKKGQKPGRRDTILERPIIPPEPPEPVLNGSMAIGAVSLAVAKTSALLASTPLYSHIAFLKHGQEQPELLAMPLLMGSVLSCGKSSPGKLNLMKELICIPHPGLTTKQAMELLLEIQKQVTKAMELPPPPKPDTKKGHDSSKRGQQPITGKMSHLGCLTINYDTIEQPVLLIQGICSNLGLELGMSLHLAINCAGQDLMDYTKGKYEIMVGAYKNAGEMVDLYVDLVNKYPSIIALIDPFRKEDAEQWDSLYNALSSKCYIIAGTASKSIQKLLEHRNVDTPKCHGLIIKHTNQTTISDLVEVTHLIEGKKHLAVLGSTEGETCDDSLVDLAVGLGVRFIKLGGLSRGERVNKYNRLLAIEEELIQNGTRGFSREHNFSYFLEETETALEDPAMMAEELLEPTDTIFPTEVVEESAKT